MYTTIVLAKRRDDGAVVPVRMSGDLLRRVDKSVRLLRSRSRNEFIREAVERYAEEVAAARILEVRDVSPEVAARLIEGYVSERPGVHHVSEIAEELGIELAVAFQAVQALIREKRVKLKK